MLGTAAGDNWHEFSKLRNVCRYACILIRFLYLCKSCIVVFCVLKINRVLIII